MDYNVTLQSEVACFCKEATANQMKPTEASVCPLTIGVTKAASFSHTDSKMTIGRFVTRAFDWLKFILSCDEAYV